MKRHAKASSAGSSKGTGTSRDLLRGAFAVRGASEGSKGSGARFGALSRIGLAAVAIAICMIGIGITAAVADPPEATTPQVSGASYATAHVEGEVDPKGQFAEWFFEVSENGTDWERTNLGGGLEGSGLQSVEGELENLRPGTEYEIRLGAMNYEEWTPYYSPEPNPKFTTDPLAAPTVAIDPVTTFTDTTATFSGTINPEAPAGNPSASDVNWHFQCTPECPNLSIVSSPTPNPVPADAADHTVEANATGLEPNINYEVTLVGKNAGDPVEAGPVSFTTTAVAPQVETIPAFAIEGGTEALVGGRINPKNSATTYWIEYGTTASYGSSAPVSEDASAGTGGTWQIFSQKIGGLTPSTVYHFRVVAKSPAGPEVSGADETFETAPSATSEPPCANATLRTENNSNALPDCRAYEQVSPVDKNGFDAGANSELEQQRFVASEDGGALLFHSFGAFADAQGAGVFNAYIARRASGGWVTQAQTPAQEPSLTNIFASIPWVTPDLSVAIVGGGNQGHLAPGDNPANSNLYRRDTIAGDYQTVSLGATQRGFTVSGGSRDGSRLFFYTPEALTPDAVEGGGSNGGLWENLYEWHEGDLKLVSIVLDSGGEEETTPEGTSGAFDWLQVTSPFSADGRRAVFYDRASGHLFLREDGVRTLEVGPGEFRGASDDLSKIFLRSGALYRFEPATETLTDLISSALPGSAQNGDLAAVSRDGEYVYFVSSNRFHPGDNPSGGRALYLWHDGEVTFIARENGTADTRGFANTYRVSPDGRRVSFASTERLTAYDNTDSVPAGNGSPRQDSEVYVYDATTDRLTCVSCNPTGQRPTGAPNGGPAADSTVPTPPETNRRSWQPGVRNDGSIFFSSRDALVSQDVNGKTDVYQWKDGHVHLISTGTSGNISYLASSSVSGSDVFFLTRERLVASDQDDNFDFYDARVGGGFPRAAAASTCEGIEGCHGQAGGAPGFDDPASGSFSSALKQPSPKAERLRKARRGCKKVKKKRARAKCRAVAKKRHGKASKGRAN